MTPVTQTVRDQAFLPLSSDIPEGRTIAQYRSQRPQRPSRVGPVGRVRLRLRPTRR